MRALSLGAWLLLAACAGEDDRGGGGASVNVPGAPGALKGSTLARAARRAYEGAPPVIPHAPFGARCIECHTQRGMAVEGIGFAPPAPHARTRGMSDESRCVQCHVFRTSDELFVRNSFEGWRPADLRGARAHDYAPPVLPHALHLRENCLACHDGPAAREEVRTTHPERSNCVQCHVPRKTPWTFSRG